MRQYISVVLSHTGCGTCYSTCKTLIHTDKHSFSLREGATVHPRDNVKAYETAPRKALCPPRKELHCQVKRLYPHTLKNTWQKRGSHYFLRRREWTVWIMGESISFRIKLVQLSPTLPPTIYETLAKFPLWASIFSAIECRW